MYNPERNADRISALIVLAIYLRQLENYELKPDKLTVEERNWKLIEMPFFTDDYFEGAHDYAIAREYGLADSSFTFNFNK